MITRFDILIEFESELADLRKFPLDIVETIYKNADGFLCYHDMGHPDGESGGARGRVDRAKQRSAGSDEAVDDHEVIPATALGVLRWGQCLGASSSGNQGHSVQGWTVRSI